MRNLLALAALVLLGGCYTFASERPLYAESAGRCPFERETLYATLVVEAGGAIEARPSSSVAPFGARCLQREFTEEGGVGETQAKGLFVRLGDEWFVVQTQGPLATHYSLVRISGERFYTFAPQCEDFSDAALAEAGVTRRKSGDDEDSPTLCYVTQAHQLETLLRAWIKLGRSPMEEGVLLDAATYRAEQAAS